MISYFQVTLIRGLELFGVDLREFSQVMQKKAASSTSGKNIERLFSLIISPLVGERADSKGAEVLVQGTFVKQVCALLAGIDLYILMTASINTSLIYADRYNIPSKWIEIKDKPAKKSK